MILLALLAIAALLHHPRLRSAAADFLLGLLASVLLIYALVAVGALLTLALACYLRTPFPASSFLRDG
jgi:hypothetical protein